MSEVRVVIPARYGSSRLPGKPLINIAGKPMIWHVWQRARESGFSNIVVATDDKRIFDVVESFGGVAVLTSSEHESGTDRLAEVTRVMSWNDSDIVVNLQGDEPLIDPELLSKVVCLVDNNEQLGMATLATNIHEIDEFFNPNVVKVVMDVHGNALYFSRAPIPWPRDAFRGESKALPTGNFYRHLGLYAYRAEVLKRIPKLPISDLEKLESLEQLRPLQNGVKIGVGIVAQAPAHGVDTEADLKAVASVLESA